MLAKRIVEALLDQPVLPPELPDLKACEVTDDPLLDTEELALEYIEGEVGRHDWEHNWPQHKQQHGDKLKDRVLAWLLHYEIDHDPQGIIDYIDTKLMARPGLWL